MEIEMEKGRGVRVGCDLVSLIGVYFGISVIYIYIFIERRV